MSDITNPHRDALALAIAALEDDVDRAIRLLEPYRLTGAELDLRVSLLELARLGCETADLADMLRAAAVARAGSG